MNKFWGIIGIIVTALVALSIPAVTLIYNRKEADRKQPKSSQQETLLPAN